jgi:hypothetical protein
MMGRVLVMEACTWKGRGKLSTGHANCFHVALPRGIEVLVNVALLQRYPNYFHYAYNKSLGVTVTSHFSCD